MDERGMQAWEDFKELSKDYQMADYADLDQSQGSSSEDILAFFEEKEGVYVHAYDEEEGSQQINFWYTADGETTIGDSEVPLYFAEIMTLFYDDKLVFASIQPGLYDPDTSAAMPFSNVTEEVSQIDDLTSLQPTPQAYNVSEMNFRGRPLTCAGVLTEAPEAEAGSEPLLVYFTFSPNEEGQGAQSSLVIADTAPFSMAAGDFGGAAFESLQAMMDQLKQLSI